MEALPLAGRTIAVPETRELEVFASLLERRGATVLRCPLVLIRDAPEPQPVLEFARALAQGSFDDLVLTTGEGLRRIVSCIERHDPQLRAGFLAALAAVRKVTRGPKPARALRELSLRADLAALEPTTAGIIASLRDQPLAGRRVAVQLYGTEPNLPLIEFLHGCGAAVIARWRLRPPPADARALLADAARSLRLALEREEALLAHQEAMTLRRSQELQRGFLSRLSHELRTPLTAIRGYASSLMQPDVTWDGESQRRFLGRIAAESARLGRLVDDLLDFSAIESGILRLQQDWCDLPLVLEAAIACLPPEVSPQVKMSCAPRLPVIWADHDRLEQVFVNLLANAIGHNPAGTTVRVGATVAAPGQVAVTVADDGAGLSPEVARAPFESARRRRAPTAGAGLGLSIAKGIVTAHGGRIELVPQDAGTCFRIWLPIEATGKLAPRTAEDTIVAGPVRAETGVA